MRSAVSCVGARVLVVVLALVSPLLLHVTQAAPAPPVTPATEGYWLVGADGSVYTFGGVAFAGAANGRPLPTGVVGMAATPSNRGYWLVTADGSVYTFGDAPFRGSVGTLPASVRPTSPIVGIARTADGNGYWLASAAGGVYGFGDARFFGSAAGLLHGSHIVTLAATPDGGGYWLASAAGGVYAFGDAPFRGSAALLALVRPIVAMAPTADGRGYWLTAGDGGVFSYGDAPFFGSTGGLLLNRPIVAMTATPTGHGYWFVASDGGVFSFGDAPFRGSTGGRQLPAPVVDMVSGRTLIPYVPGTIGYDVSFPQCGGPLPTGGSFGIVGVNDGRAFTHDPCLSTLAAWAGGNQSAYMNLNAPPSGAPQALSGPAGQCTGNNTGCMAYNYGYNAAVDAFQYGSSHGVRAGLWWIDVETANTWDINTANNDLTVQGALDALTAQGVVAGIYSTSFQWHVIAGNFAPRVPEWIATGADAATAQQFCDGTHSFGAGGVPWLTQFGTAGNAFDQDYACPQP